MDEKRVVSKYLEYRENVLKYTNIDMNLMDTKTEAKLEVNNFMKNYSDFPVIYNVVEQSFSFLEYF